MWKDRRLTELFGIEHPLHRQALTEGARATIVTAAFTGRPARALAGICEGDRKIESAGTNTPSRIEAGLNPSSPAG